MSQTAAAAAAFEGVSKAYPGPSGPVWAVRGVDLRVGVGEVVGLLGPNRAGKSTLVKLLLSLCRPSDGRVVRLGREASDRRTLARVGYVHESPTFPRDLSAAGLLHYYGALGGVPAAELRRRVPALLERVGLADRAGEPLGRFSKGMVQRVGLAQALLNAPDLLVLDEPMEGLDVAGRRLAREIVSEQRDRGGSVLLVSHALAEVEALCDRVAVLEAGHKVYDGPLGGLTRDPNTGAPRPLERALHELALNLAPEPEHDLAHGTHA